MSDFKFGVCIGYNEYEKLLAAKDAGIDFFEFNFNALSKADKSNINDLKCFLDEIQIPCCVANGMFPGEMKIVGPYVNYNEIDEYLDNASEALASLGGDTVILGSGSARRCPDGWSTERATEQIVELCREHIAPYMQKHNLVCAIEPLRSAECNIITTAARGFEICRLANVDEVKLLVDLYHFDSENEPRISLLNYKNAIQHIHIASAKNNRFYPTVTDGVDYKEFFDILRQIDYKPMRISLEGRCNDFANEIKSALDLLKTL